MSAKIKQASKALWGEKYISHLAKALGRHPISINRAFKGEKYYHLPENTEEILLSLLSKKEKQIQKCRKDLS